MLRRFCEKNNMAYQPKSHNVIITSKHLTKRRNTLQLTH